MTVTAILGSQWGDEGKGKIVDLLSRDADVVVRYHGGNNAGHRVVNQYGVFPLHLVPCGVFREGVIACISNGVVVDLADLHAEIAGVEAVGIALRGRLFISPRCHVVLSYHRTLERLMERSKDERATGTTGRGIGPVHADKVSYLGLRLIDFEDEDHLRQRLRWAANLKARQLAGFGELAPDADELFAGLYEHYRWLRPYIEEPYPLLSRALLEGKRILLEGAQGMLLDPDWGTYPYVTASTVVSGGITAGAGIPPRSLDHILGVTKAYLTRVGNGPFPSELHDTDGERLRERGHEYGTTTGRPRRCGWLDATLLAYAVAVDGLTELALTKLDVLGGFPIIKIATGYELDGEIRTLYPYDGDRFARAQPMYEELPGWNEDISGLRSFDQLPLAAQRYVERVEQLAGARVTTISVGPDREQTIRRA